MPPDTASEVTVTSCLRSSGARFNHAKCDVQLGAGGP